MNERMRTILAELSEGRIPPDVTTECEYAPELQALASYLSEVQRFALALANGDLTASMKPQRGPMVGSLKALQANLRHLTWQAQRIADGDLTQRVDFMGDFSQAFNSMVEKLSASRAELVFTGTHDTLTGLFNRTFFDAEFERLQRGRHFPISLVMVDLDGLKQINDNEGHAEGDALIWKAAQVMTRAVRAEDVVARIGGDEFVILLPSVDAPTAKKVVERLQAQCDRAGSEPGPKVRMSVGVATADNGVELKEALKLADERMYADKTARKASRQG